MVGGFGLRAARGCSPGALGFTGFLVRKLVGLIFRKQETI